MKVEKVKYVIWAKDMERCVDFYTSLFNAEIIKKNEHIAELSIGNSLIGIHGGGEGKTSGGRNPVTPWGQGTRGLKTRNNKKTDQFIISRKKKRK